MHERFVHTSVFHCVSYKMSELRRIARTNSRSNICEHIRCRIEISVVLVLPIGFYGSFVPIMPKDHGKCSHALCQERNIRLLVCFIFFFISLFIFFFFCFVCFFFFFFCNFLLLLYSPFSFSCLNY